METQGFFCFVIVSIIITIVITSVPFRSNRFKVLLSATVMGADF